MNERIKKLIVLLVVFLLVAINLFAGWTRIYGGSDYDDGNSVQQTTNGGFIVAGYTSSYGVGVYDAYLIKTNSNGDTIWTKTYGGTDYDYGNSVQQTTDGGFIVAGYTSSYGVGVYDVYLIKTNSNGDTLWTQTYGGSHGDYGNSVQQTTDGGYIIAGGTYSYGAGQVDVYLIKTNNNGDTLWTRTYGGADGDNGLSVQQTTDGGYIISGVTSSYGAGNTDVYLIKTNNNGDTLWTQTYGGADWDYGRSVQQTTDGGFIVTGYTSSYGTGSSDVYLIKTNNNGDTLWTRTYGGADGDYGYSVQQTIDGGYIIVGGTYSYGSGYPNVYLIKTDENGVTVEETIISIPEKFSYTINQVSDKNITLQFTLPENSNVKLSIYDVTGRYISIPINANYSAGMYNINFNTENKGVYFFNLKTNKFSENGKFIVF